MKENRLQQFTIYSSLFTILASAALAAQAPTWWTERHVLNGEPAEHHNPVNQGQLKWLASQAAAEFEEKVPGPGNEAIFQQVASFPAGHDFRPANLGMLKNTAKPFYDRLIELGWASDYPWSGKTPADYNLANQGQAKNLFAFDLDAIDINQDGIPDWWTRLYGSQTEQPAPLATETTGTTDGWIAAGGLLHAANLNGDVIYTLNLPEAGHYGVEIEAVESLATEGTHTFRLEALVENMSLGVRSFTASRTESGFATFDLPSLPAGAVNLTVRWHNIDPHAHLAIVAVRLLSYDAETWYALKYEQAVGHVQAPPASYTSPVCLEGRARFIEQLNVTASGEPVVPQRGIRWGWYADVELDETTGADLSIQDADSGYAWTGHVEWLAYNLLNETNASYTIRVGDSLRFSALPEGQSGGQSTILVQGLEPETLDSSNAWKVTFDAPGDYLVQGTWTNAGQTAQGEVTVHVVSAAFDTAPAIWMNRPRTWSCPSLPSEAALDYDRLGPLRLMEELPAPATGRAFLLDSVQTGDELLLARLGENGPVLARTTVETFDIISMEETGYQMIESYGDGSVLKVMPIVVGKLPEGARIRLRIIIAGLTFEDGSTEKWLSAEDLDRNGVYLMKILHAADSSLNSCHTLEVWLDGILIGRR